MAESYIQLPTDSTGKMQRHRSRVIGADTVHEVAMQLGANPTYYALADAVVPATNKHHIALFNGAGSAVVVRIRKMFQINVATVAQTGGMARFDIKRSTAQVIGSGAAVTPLALATDSPALPAQVVCHTNGTITEGSLMFPWLTYTDEDTAVVGLSKAMFQQTTDLMLSGLEFQETTLREGQGITIKQITAVTSGSLGWLLVFSVDS